MDDEHQPSLWYAPCRWHRGSWLTALAIWPPLYLLSLLIADHWAGQEPGWPRAVVSIFITPIEPLRKPFRRTATRPNPLFMPSNCEVCSEVAIFRFWEPVVSDPPAVRLRSFCDQHNREYLDTPADALKPETAK